MTNGEVADNVKLGADIAAGKYDAGIIDDAKLQLEQHGDIELTDPLPENAGRLIRG
jgi:hypothetical protein